MTYPPRQLIVCITVVALPTGCRLVALESGANEVRVVDGATSQGCEDLGETTVKVPGKIGFVSRKTSTVEAELDILARNASLDLDGNAVAASGPVEDGERSYRVLRCPGSP